MDVRTAASVVALAGTAALVAFYWLTSTGEPAKPAEAGNAEKKSPAKKKPASRQSITPSLNRRRATLAPTQRPALERRSTSVLMKSASSERIEAARASCFAGQDFAALKEEAVGLARARQAWVDDCFPRTDASMFVAGVPPKDWTLRDGERGRELKNVRVEWHGPWSICGTKRPLGTNSRGERSWLFHCLEGEEHGMDANDVQQGSLGNCYFLSALALVATNCVCADGLVDDALDQAGCYGVSFWVEGEWKMVWVDGYFPCYVSTDPHARAPPRPLYGSSANRREIWPMVVEKAYAKLHGSYEAIGSGGLIGRALEALTGGATTSLPTSFGADRLWSGVAGAVADPAVLVGAGTKRGLDEDTRRGIVEGHAYSVLHAVEAVDRTGETRRLLLLRNPWGKTEWRGDWSDASPLWGRFARVRAAVGDQASDEDDGLFWMAVGDFCEVFATIELCRLPGGAHRRTANAQLTPHPRPTLGEVPLAGEDDGADANEWLAGIVEDREEEEGGSKREEADEKEKGGASPNGGRQRGGRRRGRKGRR